MHFGWLYWIGGRNKISKMLGVKDAFLNDKSEGVRVIESHIKLILGENSMILEKSWEWLKNYKTNRRMYVDIYIESINLAIEFDGEQHFKYTEFFHKKYQDYLNQIHRDRLKDKLLEKHGVNLIRIRYDDDISFNAIENIIHNFKK